MRPRDKYLQRFCQVIEIWQFVDIEGYLDVLEMRAQLPGKGFELDEVVEILYLDQGQGVVLPEQANFALVIGLFANTKKREIDGTGGGVVCLWVIGVNRKMAFMSTPGPRYE